MITKGLEVLVVDDNTMNRKLFSMLLKKLECIVEEAESGFKCLEMVNGKKYDLIFMDHLMPELDGIETLNRMREAEPFLNAGTPVIALTANDMGNGRSFYLERGFDGYLEKPVLPVKLEELMNGL